MAPDVYKSARVPRADLERIIEASTVTPRGWPVPLLDRGNPLHGHRYIGGETEDDRHVEGWRFFTSGQFFFFEKRLFSAKLPSAAGRRMRPQRLATRASFAAPPKSTHWRQGCQSRCRTLRR